MVLWVWVWIWMREGKGGDLPPECPCLQRPIKVDLWSVVDVVVGAAGAGAVVVFVVAVVAVAQEVVGAVAVIWWQVWRQSSPLSLSLSSPSMMVMR
jgi:hypothetical protein